MLRREAFLIAIVALFLGFIGGMVGGAMTKDVHVYIDSFTGPSHFGAEVQEMPAEFADDAPRTSDS